MIGWDNRAVEFTEISAHCMQVRTGEGFIVNLTAENTGSVLWRSKVFTSLPFGAVGVGSKWLVDGRDAWKSERAYLPFDIAPGQNVTVEMSLVAPDSPRNYTLELDLVSELVTWFGSNGEKTIKKNMEVICSPPLP